MGVIWDSMHGKALEDILRRVIVGKQVVSKQLDSFLNLIMTSVFENITSLMVISLILLVYMTLCWIISFLNSMSL